MKVVLINPYELGRQPFALAQPAAWLKEAGHQVCCLELSLQQLDDVALGHAELVAVYVAALTEASIAAPIVSNDQRSRRDGALDEPTERLGATVEHDGEPNASGIASVFPVVELGARLSMTHLDGTGDENLASARRRSSTCRSGA